MIICNFFLFFFFFLYFFFFFFLLCLFYFFFFFFFQAEDGIRDLTVTGVQTCALPISIGSAMAMALALWSIGKDATVVTDAIPPAFLQPFPGVDTVRVTPEISEGDRKSVV